MNQDMAIELCPDEGMSRAVEAAQQDDEAGLAKADELLRAYPNDPRLHFLRGSLLAGVKRYAEARQAMERSIGLAPDYDVARFQLGLLELSSADPAAAEATLAPLDRLPEDHALRLFAQGLRLLARDELSAAVERLQAGIARNSDNPAINRDMHLLVEQTIQVLAQGPSVTAETSPTHMLLQQYAAKSTKH